MVPDDSRQQLTDAVIAVAERSLFALAEPIDAAAVPPTIDGGWYDAAVSFAGPFSGRVALAVPVTLAHQFCAAFLGETDVEDEAAVRDVVGELANMACGTWLTSIDAAGCFDLAHPEVQKIDETKTPDIALMINDMPVTIVAQVEQGEPGR